MQVRIRIRNFCLYLDRHYFKFEDPDPNQNGADLRHWTAWNLARRRGGGGEGRGGGAGGVDGYLRLGGSVLGRNKRILKMVRCVLKW